MRVHELAKELGMKSQELLDRIQKEGLDVKLSALASLDPSMVERIRTLVKPAGRRPGRPGFEYGHGPAPAAATSAGAPLSSATATGTTAPVRVGGEPPRPAMPGQRPIGPAPAHAPATQVPCPGFVPAACSGLGTRLRNPRRRRPRAAPPPRRPNGWSPARPLPACRARRRRVPRPRGRHRRLPGVRVRLHRRRQGGPAAASPGQRADRPSGGGGGGPLSAHTRHGNAGGSPRPRSPGNAPAQGPRSEQRPGQPSGAPGGQGFQPSEAERLHAPGRSPCDEPAG